MNKTPYLEIHNSFSYLRGFPKTAVDAVQEALTYENQEVTFLIQQIKIQMTMAYRRKFYQKVHFFKGRLAELENQKTVCWLKKDSFPTGHLELVIGALDSLGIKFEAKDLRENKARQIAYKLITDLPPNRYYQKEMLELAKIHHRGVFEAAVGSGKTNVIHNLIKEFQVPALIVAPSKDLAAQLADSTATFFGKKYVELVDGAKKIKSDKPIRIVTIQTLTSLLKKDGLKAFLESVGLICWDEAHHMGSASAVALLPYFDHVYYRFSFSGTFMRNDSKTLDMWGFASTVLYRYPASKATKDGFLTPLKTIVHDVRGFKGGTYQSEYTKNYCNNPELLLKIKEILEDFVTKNDQLLILVGRKDGTGKVIYDFIDKLGYSAVYIDGDSDRALVKESLSAFNNKKIQILIGSSIIGEGIDIRSTDHLIMAQGGKSEIAVTQAVGRAVRLYPGKEVAFLHDFKFLNTKYLEKHLNSRLDIYAKNFDSEIILCGEDDV
jgi:superfamily II DNA or RNA helicase